MSELLPELYLHGLARGDFDLALRGLLGEGGAAVGALDCPVEGGVAGRVGGLERRRLDDLEVVYLWVDGVYVKAGLEKDKAAILVVLPACLTAGRWCSRLRAASGNRRRAGRHCCGTSRRPACTPELVVGDGHLGIWGALAKVFPGRRAALLEPPDPQCAGPVPKRLQAAARESAAGFRTPRLGRGDGRRESRPGATRGLADGGGAARGETGSGW